MRILKSLVLLILCLSIFKLKAQTDNARLAPNVKEWLSQEPGYMRSKVAVFKSNNTVYLSALVKVNNTLNEKKLEDLGVLIGTKAGNIWTVRIPKDKMIDFTQLGGIDYMELDKPVRPLMDSARYFSGIDSVHQGIGVPILSGKNIVVGSVDFGFDYTNPAFYDTSYSKLRIQRVWDQRVSGTPPTGFSYGSELKDSTSILQRQFSQTSYDHGTQVGSVAAGSGYGSLKNKQFRGVAYDCDIVLVESNADTTELQTFTYTTLLDAFNYIFTYAQSVGKPAVINLSLGNKNGPHDGTSLFAQACNNLSGQGKILVFGAGNDGLTQTHLQKTFSTTDSTISSILSLDGNWADFEVWGEIGKTYCVELGLVSNGVTTAKTQKICLDKTYRNLLLIGSDKDTSFLTVGSEINPFNNKPHFAMRSLHKTTDSLYLTVTGTEGTAHLWIDGEFIGNGTWATEGDARYTVSEFASCTSCIAVGAYSSRTSWKNLQNQTVTVPTTIVKARGDIALFSSMGPTTDGRMKPDITAPGSMIGSATNSFSSAFRLGGPEYYLTVTRYLSPRNNRNYYYAMAQGTSLAAPVVTGAIALMLQVNPNLTVDNIRKILIATAIKDSFTTQSPDPTIWGAGKINAYAAIKETIRWAGTTAIPKNETTINVYPNPCNGKFTLGYESLNSGYFFVEVSNSLGKVIKTETWQLSKGKNQIEMNIDESKKGFYFICITGQGGQIVKKVILD